MIRRMLIRFEENKLEDYYQFTAVMKRLNELRNDPVRKKIIPRLHEIAKFHAVRDENKILTTYSDVLIYFDDNYSTIINKCLRPYYLK